VLTIVFSQSLV